MSEETKAQESPMQGPARESKEIPLRPAQAPVSKPRGKIRRLVVLALLALAVIAGILFGIRTVVFYRHHVETDDAQVEAHIAPVLPKVSGYVTQVLVQDNQHVEAGQLLVRLDDRDYRSRIDTARAALENAKAAVAVARANVEVARTQTARTAADRARYARLREKEEVSQQQYDAARTAAEAATAQQEAARRAVEAAQAQVAQKKGDLEYAELQLGYTSVPAPATGVVSKKSVEVGQFVQAGQPLLAIVSGGETWVVANFKETQLKKMRVGQPVEIDVDAYPKAAFHGKVESIAAATGAKFALLPPDNATGNFTKVVQRVPVKIVFTDPPRADKPLRAGMSVTAIVAVD
ncbi:MAG: HlyD family secretion protein [Acidobacteriota bacterium]